MIQPVWEYRYQSASNRWDILKVKIKEVIEKVPADSIVSFYAPEPKTFNKSDAPKALAGLEVREVPPDIKSLVQMVRIFRENYISAPIRCLRNQL